MVPVLWALLTPLGPGTKLLFNDLFHIIIYLCYIIYCLLKGFILTFVNNHSWQFNSFEVLFTYMIFYQRNFMRTFKEILFVTILNFPLLGNVTIN